MPTGATDYENLIPEAIAREVVASVADQASALTRLARVIRMPSGMRQVPVVWAAPTAGFVEPAFGGVKPASGIEWSAESLTAAPPPPAAPVAATHGAIRAGGLMERTGIEPVTFGLQSRRSPS